MVEIQLGQKIFGGGRAQKSPRCVIDAELIRKTLRIFDFTTTYGIMGFARKKSNRRFDGILF